MKPLLLAVALTLPATSFACPGKEGEAKASDSTEAATAADATRCAKRAELVGTACSYSTGMMAQRVQADGEEVTLTTTLERTSDTLPSKVAAPYTANGEFHVIANEVIDSLDAKKSVQIQGKSLEVDGVKYLLVEGFTPASS